MSRIASRLLLGLVVAAVLAGFVAIYRLRIREGSAFPAYSSLRADARGTSALFEALAELPGLTVTRNYRNLEELEPPSAPVTFVIAGVGQRAWETTTIREAAALDGMLRAGARVVIALESAQVPGAPVRRSAETGRSAPPVAEKEEAGEIPRGEPADLKALWGAELRIRVLGGEASRAAGAPAALPLRLATDSDLYFVPIAAAGWRVLYRRGGEPVVMERPMGRGTMVLMADSRVLTNGALQGDDRQTSLISFLMGSNRWIEFDEAHFGLVEEVGIAALARRYGLTAAILSLLLVALLVFWRRWVGLVPPANPVEGPAPVSHDQTAGLEAVLRRAIRVEDLGRTALADWRRTAQPGEIARIDAAGISDRNPTDTYNAAVRALRLRP